MKVRDKAIVNLIAVMEKYGKAVDMYKEDIILHVKRSEEVTLI